MGLGGGPGGPWGPSFARILFNVCPFDFCDFCLFSLSHHCRYLG